MNNSEGSFGELIAACIQLIFQPLFPILFITLCAAGYVFTYYFGMKEFFFWAFVGQEIVRRSQDNVNVAVFVVLFGLAAIPLTWIGISRCEVRSSKAVHEWMSVVLFLGGTLLLRRQWPVEVAGGWGILVYSVLFMVSWARLIEASATTLAIIAFRRSLRPRRPPPPLHALFGGRGRRDRAHDEPETI
jgi:hypothetical protein